MDRLVGTLRALPRQLRDDLWTAALEPVPRARRLGGHWFPAIVVLVVFAAFFLGIADANFLTNQYFLGRSAGPVLALIQATALLLVLFRPLLAWWVSTAMAALAALLARPAPPERLLFWASHNPDLVNGPGLALEAGVLFLAALVLKPRAAVEALAVSVVVGLACNGVMAFGDVDIVVLTIAVLVGSSLRGRQVARTKLVEQEEITAEERARRTLLEERNRIARELHDVVAHHMSVISIQAQVAPHLVENPSEELRENLAGIRQNAVEALAELRRVLGVLRSEDALADGARYTPQPTLDRLDELLGNVRGAGLTVTTGTTGEIRPLSPGVELSAFRIVQEALSNAMRHAPGAAVRVELGYQPDGLAVRVVNTAPDRPAPPSQGAGHGLLGMRERTAMLGGELATGPTPDGGWEVTAILPADTPKPSAEPRRGHP
ncbi:sensor histidine kinase [Kitasatospora cystarginea]|uniref:histidine kinase n=1 Tax=Kitasatospora cystarginea TaxID=58350 RepID=A0ABP5QKE7_9ACTN